MSKATIKDVAKMSGVSASTVSRVLSGSASISEGTCERVREAAKKLNYTPNTAARSLRCEKSKNIGVVFPDISGEFYAACASSILKYARAADYTVLFTESGHNLKAEHDGIQALMERCVDGMIFIGDNNDDYVIHSINSDSVPIVTGDRKVSGITSVTFDNRNTVFALAEGLYRAGKRKFVYIGETTDGQDNLIERYRGYTDALGKFSDAEALSIFDENLHFDKPKTAYRLFCDKLIHMRPDAVITSNDLIAQGIISAAYEKGFKIPEDMAVTGFDDIVSSAYFIPSVTTVKQDTDALACECFKALTNLIEKKETPSSILNQEIIIRASAPVKLK